MGWLEGSWYLLTAFRNSCFNSTMGWLEDPFSSVDPEWELVSIPLWDDWKFANLFDEFVFFLFQFHYGMIGRASVAFYAPRMFSFNSTMGWLEDHRCWGQCNNLRVSIPLWDDWKNFGLKKAHLFLVFQFHYGMIGRNFGLKKAHLFLVFQFHYGMIGSIA